MSATNRVPREARDWSLFSDWCESRGLDARPTTAETIAEFLTTFPAPIEAQGRRVRAIRNAHKAAGEMLELPVSERPSALRQGDEWVAVPRALAQVNKYNHPKYYATAVAGRRDAWLIVLIGIVGLNRNAARHLEAGDVQLYPRIAIKGIPIIKAESAAECPACAVTRWLRIVDDATFGDIQAVKANVNPVGISEDDHDCATGLDGTWRRAATLLPSVDRHGRASGSSMSTRAVSTVMARRQSPGTDSTIPVYVSPAERPQGRFANATMNELAEAYDDVDRKIAAALLQLRAVVGEGGQLLDHLMDFDL